MVSAFLNGPTIKGHTLFWISRSADPNAPLMKAEVSCAAVEAALCAWQLSAVHAVLGALYSPDSASFKDALASQALSGVSPLTVGAVHNMQAVYIELPSRDVMRHHLRFVKLPAEAV